MPSRIIREGWLESEPVNELDALAERFFLRLCLRADDFGRYHANPTLLRSSLFPLREDVRGTDIPRWLAACEKAGLLRCYDVDSKRFVEIHKFGQRTRATVSKFPSPPSNDGHMTDTCQAHDGQARTYSESESESYAYSESGGAGGTSASPPPPADAPNVEHDLSPASATTKPKPNRRPPQLADAEWLASLATDPAYAGIDVAREHAKCAAWCRNRSKQPTRGRLLNWLNRCDKPLGGYGPARMR